MISIPTFLFVPGCFAFHVARFNYEEGVCLLKSASAAEITDGVIQHTSARFWFCAIKREQPQGVSSAERVFVRGESIEKVSDFSICAITKTWEMRRRESSFGKLIFLDTEERLLQRGKFMCTLWWHALCVLTSHQMFKPWQEVQRLL